MPEEVDTETIVKTNPRIDMEQVREAEALLQQLRDQGLEGSSYDLDQPYERRPPHKRDSEHGIPPRLNR